MPEPLKTVREYCMECNGTGDLSSCCNAEVDAGRCMQCGKFCKTNCCYDCNGEGYNEYSVGDEVEIFICIWSDEYLRNQVAFKPKHVGDVKTYKGKIIEFKDRWNAVVKIWGREITVKIDDLDMR